MARKFSEVRKEILADPERRADIENEKAAMRLAIHLAALRERRGKTQVEIAEAMGTSQGSVSRLEKGSNPHLETLAGYVGAMGGKIVIEAVFDDEAVQIGEIEADRDEAGAFEVAG